MNGANGHEWMVPMAMHEWCQWPWMNGANGHEWMVPTAINEWCQWPWMNGANGNKWMVSMTMNEWCQWLWMNGANGYEWMVPSFSGIILWIVFICQYYSGISSAWFYLYSGYEVKDTNPEYEDISQHNY